MKLLLDTHTLLWAITDNYRLGSSARDLILDENNSIYVSAISLWEISIKHKNKPELFPYTTKQIVDCCIRAGYIFLSLSVDSVTIHSSFDYGEHKDPFDQMLIAQSIANEMKLVTHDATLTKLAPQQVFYF